MLTLAQKTLVQESFAIITPIADDAAALFYCRLFDLDPSLERTQTFYEGVGCIECNGTGYKGRMAICELLDLTDRIREMILEKRPTSEIKKAARDEGMRSLRESAVERVLGGITTLREINKVTFVE